MQAIERVFAVLRAIAGLGGAAAVGEIARTTGLPKSTVSRLLSALEEEGVVERLETAGSYSIGAGLAAIAGNVSMLGAVRETVRPYLRDLVERTGEAAAFAVPDGPMNMLYTDHIESPRPVVTRDWTGERFPYHTVAAGYAILATWTDAEIGRFVKAGLESFTPTTETTKTGILQRARAARRDGYAWTFQDFSVEINGVAAPILDAAGRAVGALSVYGPSYRFPGSGRETEIGLMLRDAAEAATRLVQGN